MKIRALIVEDEPLARERLRKLLEPEPELEIAGECGDGRQAVEMIRTLAPDLVFLDVRLPEADGFEVLEQVGVERMPAVIFVTAYDQFALRAFEVHAVDYLLKPFDRERLRVAVRRALEQIRHQQGADVKERLAALLAEWRPAAPAADRLPIKSEGRVRLVKFQEIAWLEAADNYVKVHAESEVHLLRETLTALEGRLPAGQFRRISRSAIINLEQVKELQPLFHGDYVVILRNGTRLTLSRNYREKLRELLGE